MEGIYSSKYKIKTYYDLAYIRYDYILGAVIDIRYMIVI